MVREWEHTAFALYIFSSSAQKPCALGFYEMILESFRQYEFTKELDILSTILSHVLGLPLKKPSYLH